MTTRNRIEKLALNNQIVKMRKDVKRARLWLINDLNHRVKKLNKATAKERDIEKNQCKAEKLRGEIQILKHIDVDEVSKFALCNKQESSNQVIDGNGLDIAQKVILHLANHKFVQEQVKMFREIYAVPMDRLIILIRSLGLQYQKKKKKSLLNISVEENQPKEMKKKKVLLTKKKVSKGKKVVHKVIHSPELKETPIECLHDSAEEDSKLMFNLVIQEKYDEVCDLSSSAAEIDSLIKIGPSHISQSSLENCILDVHHNLDALQNSRISTINPIVKKNANRKENLNEKIPWPKLLVPQINKTVGTMIIKQLNLDYEADTISVDEYHNKVDDGRDSNEPPRDSFFLGGVDSPLEGVDEEKKDNHFDSLKAHSRKNLGKRTSQNKTFCKLASNTRELINGPTQIRQSAKAPLASMPEVLHPSWQAKRKEKELKIDISGCHGNKITFDDD